MPADPPTDLLLTDTQLRVLTALCLPVSEGNHFATPATNQEIAEAVFLSVDAVKGHLRSLYRKFGIEDLPGDQRRVRLVELAVAGGYVEAPEGEVAVAPGLVEEDDDEDTGETRAAAIDAPEPAEPERPKPMTVAGEREREREGRSIVPYVSVAILILVVIGATLSISGIFNQGSTAQKAPTLAEYRADVTGYCREAMASAPEAAGGDRAETARGYLGAIEAVRGPFESLVQPGVPTIALERFSTGLANAARYNGDIAKSPPSSGSKAAAEDVAELTAAAGQVKAGALGYKLGHECVEVGELIARSAQNAAAP